MITDSENQSATQSLTPETPAAEVEENEENMMQENAKAVPPCPECGRTGFKDPRGLASHRRSAHGVAGSSHSVVSVRKKKAGLTPTAVPLGRPKGTAAARATLAQARPPEPQSLPTPQFSLSLLGYAMGKLDSMAEQIARENGLPERQFVRDVARSFAALVER